MLIVARFGWGKPVPINPYNLRNGPKSGMAMVSFAGPLANLFTAVLLALPVRLGLMTPTLRGNIIPSPEMVVTTTILVNVILAVFNLIPIAPLDGFKAAIGLLPYRWSYALAQLERYGPLLLSLLILPGFWGRNILFAIMEPVIRFLWVLLTGRLIFFM
jgi:Zn-dependent protease